MTKREYKIDGMTCHHCVKAIEIELDDIGVTSREVKMGSAVVEFDESKISDDQIIKAIEEAGYKVVN